jgi:GntR family transcriptional regulator
MKPGTRPIQPHPPDGAGALYRQAKRVLLQRIERQEWPPGEPLPNEATMAAELKVSIGTLRRAVDELVHEHVLVRRQGKGTYVLLHSRDRFLFQFFRVEKRQDWAELGMAQEHEYPRVECLSFERQRADETIARSLRRPERDPVFVIYNKLSLLRRPVVIDRIVIPGVLFNGLTEKRFREREGTVYNLYQTDFGITVLRARERARAVTANREAMRLLGVPGGTPLLEVQRLALTFGERPVEWRTSTIHTHRHDYVVDLTRTA